MNTRYQFIFLLISTAVISRKAVTVGPSQIPSEGPRGRWEDEYDSKPEKTAGQTCYQQKDSVKSLNLPCIFNNDLVLDNNVRRHCIFNNPSKSNWVSYANNVPEVDAPKDPLVSTSDWNLHLNKD